MRQEKKVGRQRCLMDELKDEFYCKQDKKSEGRSRRGKTDKADGIDGGDVADGNKK